MSDEPTTRADTRTLTNDGAVKLTNQQAFDRDCIEVFLRSLLKPVNSNDEDKNEQNLINASDFSFEPLKRLYMQDFYRSLLSDDTLYNMIDPKYVDNPVGKPVGESTEIVVQSNLVNVKANTHVADLDAAIDTEMNKVGPVELKYSHLHSAIEFTDSASESGRKAGLYDSEDVVDANQRYNMFQLARIEEIFDEEDSLLKEDVRREHGMLSLQTIATRMTELFARLSNVRLSMLFYTDKLKKYSKQQTTSALDIFYNLLSRLSEARRLHVEWKDTETQVPNIDILFWIDHTGSMVEVIGDVQRTVKGMATSLSSSMVRVGFTMHNPGSSTPLWVGTPRPSYISKEKVTEIGAWANKTADTIRVWPLLHFTNDKKEVETFFSGTYQIKNFNAQGELIPPGSNETVESSKIFGLPPGGAVRWGGNEYVEGLQATVRGEYCDVISGSEWSVEFQRKPIIDKVDLNWSKVPGSKRKVILISDEPNDNYINISRQFPLAYQKDSGKRIKFTEDDKPWNSYGCVYQIDSAGKLNMITRRAYKIIERDDGKGYTWERLWDHVDGQVKIGNNWYYYKSAKFAVDPTTGPWKSCQVSQGYGNTESYCKVTFTYYNSVAGTSHSSKQVANIVKNSELKTVTFDHLYFHRSVAEVGAYEQQEEYFTTNWHIGSTGHYEPKTMRDSAGYTHRVEALNVCRVSCDVWGFDVSILGDANKAEQEIGWVYVNAKPHAVDNSCRAHCPNHWDCCYFSTSGFDYWGYAIPNSAGGISRPDTMNPKNLQSFVQAFTSTNTDLYWIYWKSSELVNWQEFFRETAKYRIKQDIIKPINASGSSAIFTTRAEFLELTNVDQVVAEIKRIMAAAFDASRLFYARAAVMNKSYMEWMRPSVFVTTLVSTMMAMVTYKNSTDSTSVTAWNNMLNEVSHLEKQKDEQGREKTEDTFTWFARTDGYKYGELGWKTKWETPPAPEHTSPPYEWKGGDYTPSYTGIHLKLIDPSLTNPQIQEALKDGLAILTDAFNECFADAEVMKVLTFTNPADRTGAKATTLHELISTKLNPTDNTDRTLKPFAHLGELQYALILERIINKVYQVLGVQSSSYFIANRPKLNVDFALRFLTDSCISENNDLTGKYRIPHSGIVNYVDHFLNTATARGETDPDVLYVLGNVVTEKPGDTRKVNSASEYLTHRWSLCPFRKKWDESRNGTAFPTKSGEFSAVGGAKNVTKYISGPTCPFARKIDASVAVIDSDELEKVDNFPLDCSLKYADAKDGSLADKLKQIPPTCPCRKLVERLGVQIAVNNWQANAEDSKDYVHTLFEEVNESASILEEKGALGYPASMEIYTPNPPTMGSGGTVVDYTKVPHSNIRLVYLDHLIKLCQSLFKFNQWIAFNEPYLKMKIDNATTHYYGSETQGSFEPISCFRFTNFHAQNRQDTRSLTRPVSPANQLMFFSRGLQDQQVTAVNRDLSGETEEGPPDGYPNGTTWVKRLELDNDRTIPNSNGKLESELTRPYYEDYELASGLVTSNPKNISRKGRKYSFYQLHLMEELEGNLPLDMDGDIARNKALTTFEVYVKRFRPMYIPNAEDLYVSEDRDPLNPTDDSKSLQVNGWSIVPHKYTADIHTNKNTIIVPMNIAAHNAPRGKWFYELDYAFHKLVRNASGLPVCGYHVSDETHDYATANDILVRDLNTSNPPEYEEYQYYKTRDWIYPVSMINHLKIMGDNHAFPKLTQAALDIQATDRNSDEANDYTQGTNATGNIRIADGVGALGVLEATRDNLEYFDIYKCIDGSVHQETALNATWFYIITPPPGGGVEISQCTYPLPWVFWHSSRGGWGAGPSNYYHGCGDRVVTNHENGFIDGSGGNQGMKFVAVDAVLSQDPVKMVFNGQYGDKDGNGRVEEAATANKFYKGYYDPVCCGTDTRWQTHGSKYYGYPNGSCGAGSVPDKYYMQFRDDGSWMFVTGATQPVMDAAKARYGEESFSQIRQALLHKPMTWSLWNVLRQALNFCYRIEDPDYDKNRPGAIDRHETMSKITNEEVELKTGQSIKEMYREWYNRFTYNGNYTSVAGIGDGSGTNWPYHEHEDDPTTYWQAQRLLKGEGPTCNASSTCNVEWTNIVADVSIIYNEVSDTHDSCMTIYSGGHPEHHKTTSTTWWGGSCSGWGWEFYGGRNGGIGSGASSKNTNDLVSGAQPFRYALDGVDMCRNFLALNYHGYNSTPPDSAFNGGVPRFQGHGTLPKSLQVSREIRTLNKNGTVSSRITSSMCGTEITDLSVTLDSIYPPSEEHDTEGCDSNFLQRLLLPIYPNWDSLHDTSGHPLHPDAVTDSQYRSIVFSIAPMTYYNGLAAGNNDGAQMGERMMAFCVAQFFTGVDAEKLTTTLDAEFFAEVSAATVIAYSPTLGHDYVPGDPPWGQALVTPTNRNPSDWKWKVEYL